MINLLAIAFSVCTALTPVKVHVDGAGYLRFIRDGRVVYAKSATLVSLDGTLGFEGAKVLPEISVPAAAQSVTVDLQGNVDADGAHLGRLILAIFPAGTTSSTTDSFFTFSERPTLTNPGEDTAGVIRVDSDAQVSPTITAHPAVVKKASLTQPTSTPTTAPSMDIAIIGDGYFQVTDQNGANHYTRDGHFVTDETGQIVTPQGFVLTPNITIPPGATKIAIAPLGALSVVMPGNSASTEIGQIMLTTFAHPAALTIFTPNTFSASAATGNPVTQGPGTNGAGTLWYGQPASQPVSDLQAKRTNSTPISTARTRAATTSPTTSAGVQIEILVRQHSEVVGGVFSLGDIATISGPDDAVEAFKKVKIGETAIAGVNRIIDQRYVVLKLRGSGHHEGDYVLVVPPGADVARKTKTIAAQEIIDLAIKAAQEKSGAKVDFRTSSVVRPIVAEDGDIVLETSDPEQTAKGYVVIVTARSGNVIVGTQTVTVTAPAQLGDIKAGETVKVILKSGSAMIEVEGRALTAGFVGQKIKVLITASPNSGNGKTTTHTGTVTEAGKVEVDL